MYLREDLKIFDFRCRPNEPGFMAFCKGPGSDKMWKRFGYPCPEDITVEEFFENVKNAGITKAIYSGRHIADGKGGIEMGVSNDFVAETVAKSDGLFVGFAGLDPNNEDAVKELERGVKELGLLGVSMDQAFWGLDLRDQKIMDVLEKANELKIPVSFTMGPLVGQKYNDLYAIDDIAATFPDLTIVLSHGIYPNPTDFIATAYRRYNVYLEMSLYEFLPGVQDVLCEAASSILQDKIVYASAFPYNPLDIYRSVQNFPLSDDVFDKIFYKNTCAILGMEDI